MEASWRTYISELKRLMYNNEMNVSYFDPALVDGGTLKVTPI